MHTPPTEPRLAKTPLQRHLDERGIKQKWLAERAGIEASRISRIVRGFVPRPDEALSIGEALGVEVADLWAVEVTAPAA